GQTINHDDVACYSARRHNIHSDALSGTQRIHDAGDGAGAAVRGEVAGKHMDLLAQVQQSCSERSCSENDGIDAASSVGRVNSSQLSITVGLQEDVAHALDVNGSVSNRLAHGIDGGNVFGFADQIGQARVLDGNGIGQRRDHE